MPVFLNQRVTWGADLRSPHTPMLAALEYIKHAHPWWDAPAPDPNPNPSPNPKPNPNPIPNPNTNSYPNPSPNTPEQVRAEVLRDPPRVR